jgi:hypothetical protein
MLTSRPSAQTHTEEPHKSDPIYFLFGVSVSVTQLYSRSKASVEQAGPGDGSFHRHWLFSGVLAAFIIAELLADHSYS